MMLFPLSLFYVWRTRLINLHYFMLFCITDMAKGKVVVGEGGEGSPASSGNSRLSASSEWRGDFGISWTSSSSPSTAPRSFTASEKEPLSVRLSKGKTSCKESVPAASKGKVIPSKASPKASDKGKGKIDESSKVKGKEKEQENIKSPLKLIIPTRSCVGTTKGWLDGLIWVATVDASIYPHIFSGHEAGNRASGTELYS